MNKQRRVVITTTYNEMGIIIDTKAEEVRQPDHVADIGKKAEGDCISRKAALKICRRYWHPTYNPIMEEIEKLPPEHLWIPCSKGLPETYGAYLVQDVCGGIFVDYWRGYWLAKTTMVAWMELPEPYCPSCGADMRKENES